MVQNENVSMPIHLVISLVEMAAGILYLTLVLYCILWYLAIFDVEVWLK